MNSLQKKALLLTLILAAASTVAYLYSKQSPQQAGSTPVAGPQQHHNLTLFHTGRKIMPFEFRDQHDQPFSNARLRGQWNLLFFGFTNCPDICPPTLYQLKNFLDRLDSNTPKPQVVFVSVDPGRDTPDVIRAYLERFHPQFTGAVGSEAALIRLAKQLGIYFEKDIAAADPHAGHGQHGVEKRYSINHSGSILVVNPAGQLAGLFSTPHDADKMTEAWQKLIPAGTGSK